MAGIAGRTDYSNWNKKTNSLLSSLEKEEGDEIQASKNALGHGKYANSQAEVNEQHKSKQISKIKKQLDSYKAREVGVVQVLTDIFSHDANNKNDDPPKSHRKDTVRITRDHLDAGKRVLNVADTEGPGNIVLTEDLTNLLSHMPPNTNLSPKSYPNDAENAAPGYDPQGGTINGLVKLSLSNLKNCTVSVKCKVITGLLEISHCENVIVKICKSTTVVTVQADLCQHLKIEFHDAPSGKGIHPKGYTTMFWGEDKDDRIFHAGVENLTVKTVRDGFVDLETVADYKTDGAKKVGNATAEEVQFVTSVLDGELVTEKVLKPGSQTGTTVTGAVGGGDAGSGARSMTGREMKEVEKRKEQIRKALDDQLGGIKIVDKEGNEVQPIAKKNAEEKNDNDDDDDHIEEVYAGMTKADIDGIVKDCEAQKGKGNESFVAGEYAQAVLLYTLALDRAAELPDESDAGSSKKQLFPRHVVLSNRSASFMKLGHHDKGLKDATEAVRLEPTYVKGVFRKGLALHAMGRYQEAIAPLAAASKIEPKNKQIKQALQFAEVRMHQEMRKRSDR
jgi:tetratricopeptide (TPR) repeat protein|eukprot:scaffold10241_cov256-Chaetoceros_neogracile.AAC.22